MTLDEQIERGHRAQRLLQDDMIREAREHIEAELWRLFKSLPTDDAAGLAQVKAMQYMHGKYFAVFERAVTDGKIAQINLEAKKKSLRERVFG
jgi:hypothetical protein